MSFWHDYLSFDESLYNTRHLINVIGICTYKSNIINYRQNPTSSKPPHVKFTFRLVHQVAPDYPPTSDENSLAIHIIDQFFSQPLRVFDSDDRARLAVKAMLSRFRVPFEFRPEFGKIYHTFIDQPGTKPIPIPGFDGVVDSISVAGMRAIHDAMAKAAKRGATVRWIKIVVIVAKTVVDSEWYSIVMELYISELLLDEKKKMLEMVKCCDDDLECPICLDEVVVGTQVAKLLCSHKFHNDCIVTWLVKSHTCPVCRLSVELKTLIMS